MPKRDLPIKKRLSNLRQRYSIFFIALLFIISIAIPSVVAQVSPSTPVIHAQDNGRQLAQEAKEAYEIGNFDQSYKLWQQAEAAFVVSGEKLNQSMALSNLSLTYQKMGKWKDAQETIQRSLDILNESPKGKEHAKILAQTLDIQGRLLKETGQAEGAIDTWGKAKKIYLQINEASKAAQSKFNQTQAMQDAGYYPRACKSLLELLGTSYKDVTCPPLEQLDPNQHISEKLSAEQLTIKLLEKLEPDQHTLEKLSAKEIAIKLENIPKKQVSLLFVKELRNLGYVLQVLGEYEQSQIILAHSLLLAEKLESDQNTDEISTIYLNLGNTVRHINDKIVCNLSNKEKNEYEFLPSSLKQDSLGLSDDAEKISCKEIAKNYYQQAENNSLTDISKVNAKLNFLNLLLEYPNLQSEKAEIIDLSEDIKDKLELLTDRRAEISARLNLAQSLICLQPRPSKDQLKYSSPIVQQCANSDKDNPINVDTASIKSSKIPSWQDIEEILNPALEQAKQLNNKRVEADLFGYLGGIAQQKEDYKKAEELTQQALDLAPDDSWENITYRWYWQLGRIHQLQKRTEDAVIDYTSAFENLKSLRKNLVSINPDLQFNFRDSVEPVYRELVDLLLREENPSQDTLKYAREVIETLQIAELDNFFRDACAKVERVNVKQIDKKAGFIYSIVLPDRLEIILELPDKPLRHYSTVKFDENHWQSELYDEINILRINIENRSKKSRDDYETKNILNSSQKIYSWLFDEQGQRDLQNSSVETLVFLMDGVMQNIPIAVLHDGEEYLIQKEYRLAMTPGLQLLPPKRLEKEKIKVLAVGRTKFQGLEPNPRLDNLDNVEDEVKTIGKYFSGKKLLDKDFISKNLDSGINSLVPPIVHIATHSQFGSRLEDTYIIKWDGYIYPQNLAELMQVNDRTKENDIELLVLSACQTAAGDKRAALGMAGLAVRSGARSTLATLWNVADDSTTKLMVEFYKVLNNSEKQVDKSEALRLAQLSLLKGEKGERFKDPFYWAPFILIGNWL